MNCPGCDLEVPDSAVERARRKDKLLRCKTCGRRFEGTPGVDRLKAELKRARAEKAKLRPKKAKARKKMKKATATGRDVCAPFHKGADTSTEAFKSVKPSVRGKQRQRALDYVTGQGDLGATCDEVEVALDMRHQTASARIRELRGDGLIMDSCERRPTRTGRKARVYKTTDPRTGGEADGIDVEDDDRATQGTAGQARGGEAVASGGC